ncbi:hypothetical protein N7468_006611 [Penicillium chermesinum]|uniref:Uncharacterized protein n=1 Tax=Penicillium chermesinum TaxID=63820 RepID=A0A9W9NTA3_9EURO|nr:uncharacterized protein N7468_006611 [Penicillium chermesinum]KAJ5225386.1 hypothetical protein N7468_006611 [Penicillium chermesinum]
MMRTRDPRIRQRINQISQNLETANESAQEGLYAFSQNYISPCLSSLGNCISACTACCIPTREDQLRRRRRGNAEANFDFYDDWDNDEADDGLLGWGTGELDRLLAGSGLARGGAEQPRLPRRMSYGTRHTRRRSTVLNPDNRSDPTVIPSSSLLGFLERFPWRLGAKGVKYRPSASGLQENPGNLRRYVHEDEPLMAAMDENEENLVSYQDSGRHRTPAGICSPSDDEEDAVPLDDEFALALGRRGTGLESDDLSGSKPEIMRSPSGTSSLAETSSRKARRGKKKRSSTKSPMSTDQEVIHDADMPSLADLKKEEDQAAKEEELAIEKRRLAAQELAMKRGLDAQDAQLSVSPSQLKEHVTERPLEQGQSLSSRRVSDKYDQMSTDSSIRRLSRDQTEPFPPFPASASLASSPTPSSVPEASSKTATGDTGDPDAGH